jgi:hypothetical protein
MDVVLVTRSLFLSGESSALDAEMAALPLAPPPQIVVLFLYQQNGGGGTRQVGAVLYYVLLFV